jgi:hypothetical protein
MVPIIIELAVAQQKLAPTHCLAAEFQVVQDR